MPAHRLPLILEQGADNSFELVEANDAEGTDPKDITGWKYWMEVRKTPDAGAAILSISTEGDDPQIEVDGPNGSALFKILEAVSLSFPAPWEGFFDVVYEDADGNVVRRLEGPVTITPRITRRG